MAPPWADDTIDAVLRRRGQRILGTGSIADTLVPPWCVTPGLEQEPDQLRQFRTYFGRPSFRKVARALTAAAGTPVPLEKLEGIAPGKVPQYLQFLAWLGITIHADNGVHLARPIDNIGPTLEWYVADLCERQLRGSAAWSVRLEGLKAGGDYDVLAWLEPTLVYIECKTSPARHLPVDAFRQFQQRDQALAPELSILLVDTDDDLAGLLHRITTDLREEVRRSSGIADPDWQPPRPFIHPVPEYPGVNWGFRHLYVVNSGDSIETRLRRCVQHYHAEVKRHSFYG